MFDCGCGGCFPKDAAVDFVKIEDVPPPLSEQLEEDPPGAEGRAESEHPPDDEQEQERERKRREEEREDWEAECLARDQEREALVGAFLLAHGYSGVGRPKRTMTKTKYPLHTAAKLGGSRVLAALLEEGADPAQRDSAGRTALQVAERLNKKGSHDGVVRALG